MSTVDRIDHAITWAMDHWYVVLPIALVALAIELATFPWAIGLT